MFRSYLTIALRQLKKQKLYAVVKIGGTALGIAVCLLIGLYVRYETSYDRQIPKNLYRIVVQYDANGRVGKGTNSPGPMAAAMKTDFPEVEQAGRWLANSLFEGAGSNEFRPAGVTENTHEQGFAYADPETLDMLQLPMVFGNRASVLSEPQTLIISKRKADQYFPGINPIGKLVYLNNRLQSPYRISGVMADLPDNSHLHKTDFILSLTGHELWNGERGDWATFNYTEYVRLRKDVDPVAFGRKLTAGLLERYFIPVAVKGGQPEADVRKDAGHFHLTLQPVRNIHLYSYDIDDGLSNGDIRFVWLFGGVAVFILGIACINFINLSTARSASRAKEVGLRKVAGSARSGLIAQFLVESIVFSLFSFALGLLLAQVLLPYFNSLADRPLTMPWSAWWLAPVLVLATVIIGVLAGLYPAFYLSAFRPVQVLKGNGGHRTFRTRRSEGRRFVEVLSRGSRNSVLRNTLVVFQFAASVVLIIGTIVIYRQMHYILNRDAGFDKEQVLMIEGTNSLPEGQVRAFKTALSKLTAVKSVTISDFLPVEGTKRNGQSFYNEGHTPSDPSLEAQVFHVDEDYLPTLGIKLTAGRNFSKTMATDGSAILINETMAKQMHFSDPVGRKIVQYTGDTYTVIGVVRDFNYNSMRSGIGPLVIRLDYSPSIVSAKIDGARAAETVKAVTGLWRSFAPGQPLRYTFLDEQFAATYADVLRMGRLFTGFASLAVVIACLGLFGLSAFMAEQRSKEIGIRKVLGATVTNITALLSYDFVKLVLLAIVIAVPLGGWAMHQWLQNYAYQTALDWWIFVSAGVFAIGIALCTVSFQSVKAALENPARTLKSE